MFIDTHTHLFLEEFEIDRKEVIQRAIQKDVEKMIIPNIDDKSLPGLLQMCLDFPKNCFPTIGLHPESVKENYMDILQHLEKELNTNSFYAIGETGLDYYWDITYKKEQVSSFRHQLEWGIKLGLPVIIHVRNSMEDVLKIVEEMKHPQLTGVFHCFGGSVEEAKKIIDLGFFVGIGGVVTFKNGRLDQVIPEIPLEHILLETDSPFLAPVPMRGKRNESAYIPIIAEKIAELKKLPVSEVEKITTENALKLFKINLH